MKKTILFTFLAIVCMAMTSCHSDDDDPPFDKTLLSGNWYAEVPMTGEIKNWRTEEGEMTTYDHVGVVLHFGLVSDDGFWAHLFIKDGEMVNYDGYSQTQEGSGYFDYTVDKKGRIKVSYSLTGISEPKNMRYENGKILAEINDMTIVFTHPEGEKEAFLDDIWEMLVEEGIVGGWDDGGTHVGTDVTDDSATKPARAPRRK